MTTLEPSGLPQFTDADKTTFQGDISTAFYNQNQRGMYISQFDPDKEIPVGPGQGIPKYIEDYVAKNTISAEQIGEYKTGAMPNPNTARYGTYNVNYKWNPIIHQLELSGAIIANSSFTDAEAVINLSLVPELPLPLTREQANNFGSLSTQNYTTNAMVGTYVETDGRITLSLPSGSPAVTYFRFRTIVNTYRWSK